MSSKVSKFVDLMANAKSSRPIGLRLNDDDETHILYATVSEWGDLNIRLIDAEKEVYVPQNQALALARWILDNYGEASE